MQAPEFWYQSSGMWAGVLSPLSLLYKAAGLLRRAAANPYQSKIPIICVGNIVSGGSGKTPTALALAALLKQQGHKPVFVTRGYGGSEAGPLRVDPAIHSAMQVGDEALLLARTATIWIGRDRTAAIRKAETEASHIILDDGLQNPYVKPDLSFLIIDAIVGFGNGHILPAGPLRETLDDVLPRIHAILVVGTNTKDVLPPNLPVSVLKAHLEPTLADDFRKDVKYFVFAGIGRPEKFYAACRGAGLNIVGTRDFPDHHTFTSQELDDLQRVAKSQEAYLLTTEKDVVRIPAPIRTQIKTFPVNLEFDDVGAVKQLIGKLKSL
jgi:tetraacyldisaccharide 4'-kinase